MKNQRLKAVVITTALSASALMGSVASAETNLGTVLQVGNAKTTLAQESQKRIDRIAQETDDLTQQFRDQNRLISDLRAYNAQLEKQVAAQLKVITDIDGSIEQVTVIERQIQPLIVRMLDTLEQFVQLDRPFRLQERLDRVQMLRNNLERPDISVSEKFRQVLEAYKIETDAGRFLDSYSDNIEGLDVNVLQVGRISLMYQTTDGKLAKAWDANSKEWVTLDSSYASTILKGFRIARKQATLDSIAVPVQAPEAAQ